MTYHHITREITTLLTENGCWFETFEHEPVRTSEEAAQTRPGYTLRQGAKAIVVKVGSTKRGDSFAMLVMPADVRFDSKKVRQMLGVRTLRFATEEEIGELTGGVLPGAIPPFGTLFGLPVYADAGIFENERIVFNAGDRRFSVAMRSADYARLVRPRVVSLENGK